MLLAEAAAADGLAGEEAAVGGEGERFHAVGDAGEAGTVGAMV